MEKFRNHLVVITVGNKFIKDYQYATTRAHAIDKYVFAHSYDYPNATYQCGNVVREAKKPNAQEIINKF